MLHHSDNIRIIINLKMTKKFNLSDASSLIIDYLLYFILNKFAVTQFL